jgi:hypothetical protein
VQLNERCEHFDGLQPLPPPPDSCAQCVALGLTWTQLRVCLTCGHVGCCEDSKLAHALAHYKESGHPIIAPQDRRETWSWCYIHRKYYELPVALRPRRRSLLRTLLRRN